MSFAVIVIEKKYCYVLKHPPGPWKFTAPELPPRPLNIVRSALVRGIIQGGSSLK